MNESLSTVSYKKEERSSGLFWFSSRNSKMSKSLKRVTEINDLYRWIPTQNSRDYTRTRRVLVALNVRIQLSADSFSTRANQAHMDENSSLTSLSSTPILSKIIPLSKRSFHCDHTPPTWFSVIAMIGRRFPCKWVEESNICQVNDDGSEVTSVSVHFKGLKNETKCRDESNLRN